MDETKLTKKDKEEIVDSTKELLLDLLNEIMAKLNELAEEIEKC